MKIFLSALRFTDGEISWVSGLVFEIWMSGGMTVFSQNDISGLIRTRNFRFGRKVASSMKMMCTLRFL